MFISVNVYFSEGESGSGTPVHTWGHQPQTCQGTGYMHFRPKQAERTKKKATITQKSQNTLFKKHKFNDERKKGIIRKIYQC